MRADHPSCPASSSRIAEDGARPPRTLQSMCDVQQYPLHVRRVEADPRLSEAERRQPGREVGLIAHAIALLGLGPVIAQAVRLDDEVQLRQ